MSKARKHSRLIVTLVVLVLIGAGLAAAFWPRPVMVDLAEVTRGSMMVTIDEEGRTRVREAYVVSTPIAGRLQRVEVNPGDPVIRGQTVVAQMLPINPSAMDVRTREQAQAGLQAADAALRVAKADLNAALAGRDLAAAELERSVQLSERGLISSAAYERTEQGFRVAEAAVETAEAAISMREAEVANARAQLVEFGEQNTFSTMGTGNGGGIPLLAPADGRILRIMQQSETTLPAGAPIMEIGDIDGELEVVVELISSDAVQVNIGDTAIIDDWGGPVPLKGQVSRIDPFAITKFSALGVEEQRVPVTITLTGPPDERDALGHGYRIEARIVVWQADAVIRVPSSALFRSGEVWSVFVDRDGTASLRRVEPGRNNGRFAEVVEGLEAGERVVLYPPSGMEDGTMIASRQTR